MTLPSISIVSAAGEDDLVGAALGWSPVAAVDLPDPYRFVVIQNRSSLTTSFGNDADLSFASTSLGDAGVSTTISYVISGLGTVLSVSVVGSAIEVDLATDGLGAATSTAADVLAAVEASGPASALVTVMLAPGQDGTGIPGALVATPLSGGVETICGVLQTAALSGESCDVVFQGVSQVEAGAAFSTGDVVGGDGVGRAVPVNASSEAAFLDAGAALALEDAAGAGELAWCLVGARPQRVGVGP